MDRDYDKILKIFDALTIEIGSLSVWHMLHSYNAWYCCSTLTTCDLYLTEPLNGAFIRKFKLCFVFSEWLVKSTPFLKTQKILSWLDSNNNLIKVLTQHFPLSSKIYQENFLNLLKMSKVDRRKTGQNVSFVSEYF